MFVIILCKLGTFCLYNTWCCSSNWKS